MRGAAVVVDAAVIAAVVDTAVVDAAVDTVADRHPHPAPHRPTSTRNHHD
jgi:hypothetical protein